MMIHCLADEGHLSRIAMEYKGEKCMSISISDYPVHLQDGLKLNRECLKSQGSQNENQKVFHRDSLEVSQLPVLMDRIKPTVVHPITSFSDMRA